MTAPRVGPEVTPPDVMTKESVAFWLLSTEAGRELRAEFGAPLGQPVAWEWEQATVFQDGEYGVWSSPRLTPYRPQVPPKSMRNLRPLYALSASSSATGEREAAYKAGVEMGAAQYAHQSGIEDLLLKYEVDSLEDAIACEVEIRLLAERQRPPAPDAGGGDANG